MRTRTWRAVAIAGALSLAVLTNAPAVKAITPQVLNVCPTGASDDPATTGPAVACPAGAFSSIQAAVNAANPGDWVLVAPGIYHEKAGNGEGVTITKAGLHLRGLDRNGVVVDGTNQNAHGACSTSAADQDTSGSNGVVVHKADGTSIENLTVCNYLNGANAQGNEIWWNGGDGSGTIGLNAYTGAYITGTTTYSDPQHAPQYGIFVSNSRGPGVISYAYAANMSDSAFYVGACPDCNATLNHVHAENSALGYSGTNAGGHLLIENSEWDLNKDGVVPNSLNNDDAPPPQSGACPSPGTGNCTVITGNLVHDNNNPNVPGAGIANAGPIGTGIELSGASYDTVSNNVVYNQNSWGILINDYPDTETPPVSGVSHCQGGVQTGVQGTPSYLCTFRSVGDIVSNNTLFHNGAFGNATNGDLALESTVATPADCFYGNVNVLPQQATNPNNPNNDTGGVSSDPPMLQASQAVAAQGTGGPCPAASTGDSTVLIAQLACASGLFGQCPNTAVANYPQQTAVTLLPLSHQDGMSNPCAGVPDNAWCSGGQLVLSAPTNVAEAPLLLGLPLSAAAVAALAIRRSSRRRRAAGA